MVYPLHVQELWRSAYIGEIAPSKVQINAKRFGISLHPIELATCCPHEGAGYSEECEEELGEGNLDITLYGITKPENFHSINLTPSTDFS